MLLDVDIRDPLFYYLESVYGKIRVLEEKVIGRVRADFFHDYGKCFLWH